MRSYPKGPSARRLDTVEDIKQRYNSYGTHHVRAMDVPLFEQLCSSLSIMSQQPANRDYYSGWLQYELAIARHSQNPGRALHHYVKSATNLASAQSQYEDLPPKTRLGIARTLIDLQRSRLDPDERLHGLNHQAAMRNLGNQTLHIVETLRSVHTSHKLKGHMRSIVGEAATAGVLLCLSASTPDTTSVVGPATPRQRVPYSKNRTTHRDVVVGINTTPAFNLIHYYDSPEDTTGILNPRSIAVRRRMPSDDDEQKYAPATTVLYCDRDLFVDNDREFVALGRALVDFASGRRMTSLLTNVCDNVELAFESRDN